MYSTILVPTDGSEGASEAVAAATTLAAQFDATMHFLYVVDERFVEAEYDMVREEAEHQGERALDEAGQQASSAGISAEKHLRHGTPHEEILDAVDDYDADLVLMGKHGRTGLDRFLHLGSVTDRVIRGASVHVLTVPLEEE